MKEFFKDVANRPRAEVDRIYRVSAEPVRVFERKIWTIIQEVAVVSKVSLLVHPDKCNHPKASVAFDAIGQAQKLLTTVDFKKEIDFNLDQAKKKVVSYIRKR